MEALPKLTPWDNRPQSKFVGIQSSKINIYTVIKTICSPAVHTETGALVTWAEEDHSLGMSPVLLWGCFHWLSVDIKTNRSLFLGLRSCSLYWQTNCNLHCIFILLLNGRKALSSMNSKHDAACKQAPQQEVQGVVQKTVQTKRRSGFVAPRVREP